MTRCINQEHRERRSCGLHGEVDVEQDICDVTLWLIEKYRLKSPHVWVDRHSDQTGRQIAGVTVIALADHVGEWTAAAHSAFLAIGYEVHDRGADIFAYQICNGKHSRHDAIKAYARIERALENSGIYPASKGGK